MNNIDRLMKAEKGAWSRAGAYIIMKDGDMVGKIKVAYPRDGASKVTVFLWDFDHDLQVGTASGYGYDKVGAALQGLMFRELVLSDNWDGELREAGYQVINAL